MRLISTALWQTAIVLLCMTAGMNYLATFMAGVAIGIWFIILTIAINLGRELR